ncbi:MAG: Ig-like domain-containing protein [Clostridia bacterium]|nr:Ig-like domain-containing protein [Clostridia bacterium]
MKKNDNDTSFSLKDDGEIDALRKRNATYFSALDGVMRGENGAKTQLYKFVELGYISKEQYEEIIEKYGAIPKKQKTKTRFCKMCGNPIDAQSKKCISCGKQYFKGIKFNKLIIALLIALFFAVINKDYLISKYIYNVSITGEEINLEIDDVYKLSCVANYDSVYSNMKWRSSNPSVARVSNVGLVVAQDEGSVQIDLLINDVVKDSCIVNVSLTPVYVRNGEVIVSPQRRGLPEVTVNAPNNADCYVYLKNIYNSNNNVAFYVKSGSSATVNVPTGTYELYYATGETWYGQKYKFGKATSFYKSDNNTILSENSRYYDVVEFTLYAVSNGNMHTETIDETEFPD